MPFSRAQQLSVLRLRLLGYCSPPSLLAVAARNLHEPAPEWLLLFRQRPPSTPPPPPVPSRRSIVGCLYCYALKKY